ncbi:hypothetical protein J7D54_00800 [Tessaracoccus sp. MC1865]|uniref:SRPBCC family protein n=1 Tax=Tessaracoccus sp. MC1865 TaxID=2760310 RepID=UPI001AE84FF0|nr:hypothetical protein [Tessaracoccus sp. MC1865]QTO37679.1 hypothetical protein J7D54_00800 [Tessaracoccus sp. MC1865]
MPVTDVSRNLDEHSLTLTAEFAAPVERLWQIYADPRQLERVWARPDTRPRSSITASRPAAA